MYIYIYYIYYMYVYIYTYVYILFNFCIYYLGCLILIEKIFKRVLYR